MTSTNDLNPIDHLWDVVEREIHIIVILVQNVKFSFLGELSL